MQIVMLQACYPISMSYTHGRLDCETWGFGLLYLHNASEDWNDTIQEPLKVLLGTPGCTTQAS